MGMYTQLILSVDLYGLSQQEIDILNFMTTGIDYQISSEDLPEHDLFKTERWDFMLRCDSYYFQGSTINEFKYDEVGGCHTLSVIANLKNYKDEISKFLNWIEPHIEGCDEYVGSIRYEEHENPTLIYIKDDKFFIKSAE